MAWPPYRFLTPSDAEKAARREALDLYAGYAQFSAVLPALVFLLFRVGRYLVERSRRRAGSYDAIPHSPSLKTRRMSNLGGWETRVRKARWWLGDQVVIGGQSWGEREQWIFGAGWFCWLLVLCVVGTGDGEF
jgi:hypothetical protein